MISLIGGDWRFFWPQNIGSFANFPLSWDASLNTGIGTSAFSFIWINTYLNFTAFISNIGLPWSLVGFLFWIFPAFIISFASSFLLYRHIFPGPKIFGVLAGIIYTSNTHILMIVTGGQLGVSLAYSLVPLVLYMFIKAINNLNYKTSILFSLVLALEVLFDPRISYLTGVTILLYVLFRGLSSGKFYKEVYFAFIIPLVITITVHSYWIVPVILFRVNSVPIGFDSIEGLKFLSFADFSHSFSLLHPNWPENIFGQTYFMKSEFIFLPILAFSSLLFLKFKRKILFFAALGLGGAFLAKGVNPPYGEVYIWLFNNLPGFVVFRDPTKWYILVAASYSMLIPFVLSNISQKLSKYLYILFIVFWISIMSPGIFQQVGKNFKIAQVPREYSLLKDFLVKDKDFYRTLWIPAFQRFGYFSNLHPAVRAPELFKEKDNISIIKEMGKSETATLIKDIGVKYVIVPYDSEGEIFLRDRKYDSVQYEEIVSELRKVEYLRELSAFGKIAVFEGPKPNDRFFIKNNDSALVSYKAHNPTKYTLSLSNAKKGDALVFSEGFDVNWQAKTKTKLINSKPYAKLFNSFTLQEDGNYNIEVNYRPQKFVDVGVMLSIGLVIFLILLLII